MLILPAKKIPTISEVSGGQEEIYTGMPSGGNHATSIGKIYTINNHSFDLKLNITFGGAVLGTDSLRVPIQFDGVINAVILFRGKILKSICMKPSSVNTQEIKVMSCDVPEARGDGAETEIELWIRRECLTTNVGLIYTDGITENNNCIIETTYKPVEIFLILLGGSLSIFLTFSIILFFITAETSIKSQYKSFAVMISAGFVFFGLFGLPVLRQFSLKKIIFPLVRLMRKGNTPFIVSLILANYFIFDFSISASSCVYRSHVYRTKITDYMNNHNVPEKIPVLLSAFEMFPSRPEAMILLSAKARDLRVSDRTKFHQFMKTLFENDGPLTRVLQNVLEKTNFEDNCLSLREKWPIENRLDPDVWILSVMPEADDKPNGKYSKLSVEGLKVISDHSPLAKLFLLRLSLETTGDDKKYKELLIELVEHSKNNLGEIQYTHFYQEALDAVAQDYMLKCDNVNALRVFSEVMEIRRGFANTPLRWLRPPDKLVLFNLVRASRAPSSVMSINQFRVANNISKRLKETCPDDFILPKINDLFRSAYPVWIKQDEQIWYRGTVFTVGDENMKKHISSLLNTFWRF